MYAVHNPRLRPHPQLPSATTAICSPPIPVIKLRVGKIEPPAHRHSTQSHHTAHRHSTQSHHTDIAHSHKKLNRPLPSNHRFHHNCGNHNHHRCHRSLAQLTTLTPSSCVSANYTSARCTKAAEVRTLSLSPNTTAVYVTNRGHNSIRLFLLDEATGQLSPGPFVP